jgi:hypothetical protein
LKVTTRYPRAWADKSLTPGFKIWWLLYINIFALSSRVPLLLSFQTKKQQVAGLT